MAANGLNTIAEQPAFRVAVLANGTIDTGPNDLMTGQSRAYLDALKAPESM
jgi:hypothetical protein